MIDNRVLVSLDWGLPGKIDALVILDHKADQGITVLAQRSGDTLYGLRSIYATDCDVLYGWIRYASSEGWLVIDRRGEAKAA